MHFEISCLFPYILVKHWQKTRTLAMDEVNLLNECVIKIEQVKQEYDSQLEDAVWIYTELDEPSSPMSHVMEEDEEEHDEPSSLKSEVEEGEAELKPPVKVFVEAIKKQDVTEEYEDPLPTLCNEDISVASIMEREERSPSSSSSKERNKRKRSRNFDECDKLLLLDLAIGELEIISCKQTDQVSNEKRRRAWARICAKYNAASPLSGPRNSEQLKSLYDMLGRNARKDRNRELAERLKSGRVGRFQLSETTLKVLKMLEGIKPIQNSGHGKSCEKSVNNVGNGEGGIFTSDQVKQGEENAFTGMFRCVSETHKHYISTHTQTPQMHTESSPSAQNIPPLNSPASARVPNPVHSPEEVQVTPAPSPMLQTHSHPSNTHEESASASHTPVQNKHYNNQSPARTRALQPFAQRQHRFHQKRLFDLKCRKEEQLIKNLEKEYEERSKRCQLLDVELEIKKKELALKAQELDKISK